VVIINRVINICNAVGENMARSTSFVMLFIFASISLSGCLFSNDEDGNIDLIVNYDSNFETIVETYSEGEIVQTNPARFEFDFSKTTASKTIQSFGITSLDGQDSIEIDASNDSIIAIEFYDHGMYEINAYAIDVNGVKANQLIDLRVDLRIDWTQSDTNNPLALPFNPEPANQGQNAKMIEIISNVENPSLVNNIGDSGQSIQLTWQLVDELDDICQTRNGQINDGDTMMWQTLYFNTYMLHELRIVMDDGQDSINVNQSVSILYDN
tara:strand:+ start:12593 stop:13396 length:804 start_codon:yes stop_codon:yes gene_type:complete